jgi:rhamnosyltransferase
LDSSDLFKVSLPVTCHADGSRWQYTVFHSSGRLFGVVAGSRQARNSRELSVVMDKPIVSVLLATCNGLPWIGEQVRSILEQENVIVEIVVSDDMSTDGTWEWLVTLSQSEPRVTLLPRVGRFGRAGANFFRLLREVARADPEFVAFADQDDIWLPDKLATQVEAMHRAHADGVSSDVIAFWKDGRRAYIRKSHRQRSLDFLCEAPGPGCTLLLSRRLVATVAELLDSPATEASEHNLHDWLVYAVCRAKGWRWHIQNRATLLYRQHGSNELGANVGVAGLRRRLKSVRNGWYRAECQRAARISELVATGSLRTQVANFRSLLERPVDCSA